MARIRLGASPEELERELVEKQQQLAEEVLKRNQLKEKHILEIKKVQKKNRIIVVTTLSIVLSSLLIFGTYNTFFKKVPTTEDLKGVLVSSVRQFNVAGLDGYIRNNFTTWFKELHSFKDEKLGLEKVNPNLDSLTIDDVVQISNTVARVYFTVDIESKTKDIENADKTITKGVIKNTRYRFYIPVESYSQMKDGKVNAIGYRPLSHLSMFMNDRVDTHVVAENESVFAFNKDSKETEENIKSAQTKVDRTLSDLYEKKDTKQDLHSNLVFNGYGSKYLQLLNFEFYKEKNELGYNAKVTYLIRTQEGFEYKQTSYMLLVKNGSSWRIAGIL